MRKIDLNKLLKILKIILLILIILSILPRLFSKGYAEEVADPVPTPEVYPTPEYNIVFPEYDMSDFSGIEDFSDNPLDKDNIEKIESPENSFFESANSFFDINFELSYINSFINNASAYEYGLENGLLSYDEFLSYSKMYEICIVKLILQAGLLFIVGVYMFKGIRSFF